ncbi:MAG: M16 family metallopeptidase, partial [Pyrinomonadaceae bacterium]
MPTELMEIRMYSKKFLTAVFALAVLGLVSTSSQEGRAQQPPQPQKQTPPAGSAPKSFTIPPKQTFTLKNGMKVTFIPYGTVPKVTVSAVVRAGNINETPAQTWLADLTGAMLKEGTTTRTAEQIAQEAARMGGSINVGVGMDQTTVGGDVLSEFGPELVKLMADVIQRPLLPAADLQRLKNNQLRQLSIARTQPGQIATERFRKTLYPEHPYGRIFPTEEMVKGYTVEDVQKFYRANFGAARTHLYVAGRFDSAVMKKAVTEAFENWAGGSAPAMNVPVPVAARSIHLIDRPGAAQSTLYLGLPVVDPS